MNIIQKDFIVKSYIERIALCRVIKNHKHIKVLKTTKANGFERHDAIISSGDTSILLEIKVRSFEKDKYDSIMIEEPKFNYLLEKAKELNMIAGYLSIYTDGAILFKLEEGLVFNDSWGRKNNYNQERGKKRYGFLEPKNGEVFNLDLDYNFLNFLSEEMFKVSYPNYKK